MAKSILTRILLFLYIVFIFYCTVYIKELGPKYNYDYHLFWSYNVEGGGSFYFKENMLNVFLYMPIGFLMPLAIRRIKWWKAALCAMCISLLVEFIQLVFKCGFSELDDVFHNTLGCVIGFFLYKGIIAVYKENYK